MTDKYLSPFIDTIRATWINIWIASSESHWFNPDNLGGTRIFFGDKKMSINWDDMNQARQHLQQIRDAGVQVVLFDMTNGFHDFVIERAQKIGRICRELDLQFAFAAGNAEDDGFEQRARLTWENFCGDGAEFSDCYFKFEGKPVLVLYVVREQFERLQRRGEGYLSRFYRGWASGEDPDIDKWGWQLTPSVGSVSSANVMYITCSLWWDRSAQEYWHKSLSYLDYNFLKALQAKPRLLIIGSFDDVCERNSWMPVDTTDAPVWLHQRSPIGDIDPLYYYHRVSDWLSPNGPKTVPGGMLPDGAYRMLTSDGCSILATDREDLTDSPVLVGVPVHEWQSMVWLYHLGNGEYRLIRLFAGKSLADNEGTTVQTDDLNVLGQRWKLIKDGENWQWQNVETGKLLFEREWSMIPDLLIP